MKNLNIQDPLKESLCFSKIYFIKNSYTKLFGSHSVEYQNFLYFPIDFCFSEEKDMEHKPILSEWLL